LFYLKLAWRNILRNKRRTFIAGTAIGLGLAALIFTDALYIGMENHMIYSATSSFLGEGQIHHEDFRETLEIEKTIMDLDATIARLRESDIVDRFTMRTMAFAMIASPSTAEGISLLGVDPHTEKDLSHVDEVLIEGEYFAGGEVRDIIIGSKLAEILEVELGDRVVVTASEAHTGDLAQELFRVSGIYHFNISEMDRTMAFIRLGKAQQMLGLDRQAHEIAIKFTENTYGRDETLPLWDELSTNGNEALGWTVLMPQLSATLELSDFSVLIIALVLFAVVALGIINTLFMSLYERMFEFGVLRAVGTRPRSIARLIISEAGALSIVSIILGVVISVAITVIINQIGIDYRGIEYAGVTFTEKIYPVLEIRQFIKYPVWVFAVTTLVGTYPAIYAARLTPARALRKSF
jgi:ABC-type lipoprotein release transport system permease subunit